MSVELGDAGPLPVKGEAPAGADGLDCAVHARDFTLRGRAAVDQETLLAGFRAYPYVLGAMALSLLLLLGFTFRLFRRKISRPIAALMDGAADIQRGQWGRQIDCQAGSREFENLYSQPQTPCGRVFFRHTALRFLAIHKVFLRKRALSGGKIPRPPGIFGCEYRF